MGSEKFCLRWNEFEGNISSAFRELRDDKDFFDVTLACEDEQIQAHRVILSACSPFFRNVLRRNPHQHPLLYLKGVTFNDLQSVLNFMYHGEVSVAQEELNSFLAVAEDLRVKGLTQAKPGTESKRPDKSTSQPKEREALPQKLKRPISTVSRNNSLMATTQECEEDIPEVVEHHPIKSEPRDSSHMYSTDQTHALTPAEGHTMDTYHDQDIEGYQEGQQYEEEHQMTADESGQHGTEFDTGKQVT